MELFRILYLFLLTVCCVCTPNRLSCGTVGSAASASSHGVIADITSETLTVSETSGGSAISRAYIPGETLYVALSASSSASQYSIELSSGSFDSGSTCVGKRKLNGLNLHIHAYILYKTHYI